MAAHRCHWRSYCLYPSDLERLGRIRQDLQVPDISKALRQIIRETSGFQPGIYVGPFSIGGKAERHELVSVSLTAADASALRALAAQAGLANGSQAIRLAIRQRASQAAIA